MARREDAAALAAETAKLSALTAQWKAICRAAADREKSGRGARSGGGVVGVVGGGGGRGARKRHQLGAAAPALSQALLATTGGSKELLVTLPAPAEDGWGATSPRHPPLGAPLGQTSAMSPLRATGERCTSGRAGGALFPPGSLAEAAMAAAAVLHEANAEDRRRNRRVEREAGPELGAAHSSPLAKGGGRVSTRRAY